MTRDADEKWKEEVETLREICRQNGIDALTERSRSGRGVHVWIFFRVQLMRPLRESLDLRCWRRGRNLLI